MALIQTVDSSDLYHLARRRGRGDTFGDNGWRAIGDYLENLSTDTEEDVEIDIIAICCDFSMAESVKAFYMDHQHLHGIDLPTMEEWEELEEDEKLAAVSDYLQENTALVVCEDDLIIWQAF